ncbi:MAG: fibrillarin-like rRNA/tRNA 2'-O-methyltransferase [Candidatus Diapherotrites archaeon]|nr:fibrillarin-like rRNA/tRNA 2'-O-methyltransferase [Candidatus Diapherotrites archaeon]
MKKLFHNVFRGGKQLYTLSLDPGQRVYGEKLVKYNSGELRQWDPNRSKLAAAIMNGLKNFPFDAGTGVLYLGAAQGTTPSHVSDVVEKGVVVCVEISQRAFEKLLPLCERRENMVPVLADANHPEEYADYLDGVSVVYQDVAQPRQAAIFVKNMALVKGYGLLCIKARSVDVSMEPKQVFKKEINVIKEAGIEVLEVIPLEPFEKDHVLVVCKN